MTASDTILPKLRDACALNRCAAGSLLLAMVCMAGGGCLGRQGETIRKEILSGRAVGSYVTGVPFVRQKQFFCGPAALASVARFYGKTVDQDEVAQKVFSEKLKGSLTLDLQLFARDQGYWTSTAQQDLDDLKLCLDLRVPVIVFMQVGPRLFRQLHFVVVTGYEEDRGIFLAHDGYRPDAVISFRSFERQWRRAGSWSLVMAPPEKVHWELDAEGLNGLGVIYERGKQFEKALDLYDRAINLDPGAALYHLNRSNVLFKKTGPKGADIGAIIEGYRTALRLEPDYADAHNNLAYVLKTQGQLDKALKNAESAVAGGGRRLYEYYDTLAEIRLARGEREEAARAYQAAIDRGAPPPDRKAGLIIAVSEIDLALGRIEEARKRLRSLLAVPPTPSVARRVRSLLEKSGEKQPK